MTALFFSVEEESHFTVKNNHQIYWPQNKKYQISLQQFLGSILSTTVTCFPSYCHIFYSL